MIFFLFVFWHINVPCPSLVSWDLFVNLHPILSHELRKYKRNLTSSMNLKKIHSMLQDEIYWISKRIISTLPKVHQKLLNWDLLEKRYTHFATWFTISWLETFTSLLLCQNRTDHSHPSCNKSLLDTKNVSPICTIFDLLVLSSYLKPRTMYIRIGQATWYPLFI